MNSKQELRMKILKTVFFLTILFGIANADDVTRLQELIPDHWVETPGLNFALPGDYKLYKDGMLARTYWCKEEDVETIERSSPNLKNDLIEIDIGQLKQTGPDTLMYEDKILDDFIQADIKWAKLNKYKWGTYPVFEIYGEAYNGAPVRMGWVGLNSPHGTTMLMILRSPKNRLKNEAPLWDNLIKDTTQLSEPEFFKAKGYDMQDGFTIFSNVTAKVKATVERRVSDGLMAIKLEPLTPNTSFEYSEVFEGLMGNEWKKNAPIVKIAGKLNEVNSKFGDITTSVVITVLIKDVQDFRIDVEAEAPPAGGHIFTRKSDQYL